jgi:hypothetical protein
VKKPAHKKTTSVAVKLILLILILTLRTISDSSLVTPPPFVCNYGRVDPERQQIDAPCQPMLTEN